jgi:hypothetical protein
VKVDERSVQKAQQVYAANVSPRARRLDWLERYAGGTQYEGRASFWNDDVPLQERAPCVVIPIGARAAESNVDLCLGEGRAPTFALQADADDVFDERLGLSEEQAEVATRFITAVCEQADLVSAAQELLAWAQIHGTACVIVSAVNGRLCVDREDAKWCTPTFDEADHDVVASLEIRYPFLEDYIDDAGRLCKHCMLYRRVIDAQRDVTYKPAPATENGMEPDAWIEDHVVEHGLGFCPVRWYRYGVRGKSRSLDGEAIHAKMTDEIDALCIARSQIHRACVYASDPQIIETGVAQDYQQAPRGRTMNMFIGPGDHPENAQWTILGPDSRPIRSGGPATRRGPGVTWRYESDESDVSFLTLPGDALKPAEDNYARLDTLIKDMLGVVFLDPQQMKLGDISGRALEILHKMQIDRCNRIRKDFGRRMLVPVLHMLLRVALKTTGTLYIPGVDKARAVLERFEQEVEGAVGPQWFGPEIRVTWGPYFKPTAIDAKADTENAIAAFDAGFITKRTAVEKMAAHYPDIKDVDAYLESLEEEAEEKAKKMHDAAKALMPPGDEQDEDAPESAARPKIAPPPRGPREPKAKKPPVVRGKKRAKVAEDAEAA